ncbi:MAG: glycosyltransferase family 2 protein [Methanobacteriaceae archaeon]
MKSVKISTIIPVYNAEDYLEECLNSITNQTLNDIEIICVDDGSDDNSLKKIEKLAKKDNRIKIFKTDKNSGAGVARNIGLENAKGDYISFVDSDDFLFNDKVYEKLYNHAIKEDSNILKANLRSYNANVFKNIEENHPFCSPVYKISKEYPYDYGVPWYFHRLLFKRVFLEKNNIKFPPYFAGEDPLFVAKTLRKVNCIDCLPIDFYAYRGGHKGPNTLSSKEKEKQYIQHFKEVLEILDTAEFNKVYIDYEDHMYELFLRQKYMSSSKYIDDNIKEVFGEGKVFHIYNMISDLKKEYILEKIKREKLERTYKKKLKLQKKEIKKLKNSHSWKITKPFRKLSGLIKK